MSSAREHNIKYIQTLTYIFPGYEWWFLFCIHTCIWAHTHKEWSLTYICVCVCACADTQAQTDTHTDTYTQAQRQGWMLKTREHIDS